MKKFACLFLAFTMLALTACSSGGQSGELVKYLEDDGSYGDFTLDVTIPYIDKGTKTVSVVNSEIEMYFVNPYYAYLDDPDCNYTVYSDTVKNGDVLSIRILRETSPIYGTDGTVYAVNYDTIKDAVLTVPYILKLEGLKYDDLKEELRQKCVEKDNTLFEYFEIPYFYYDENGAAILIVTAVEHPEGADSWYRIYYYNLGDETFITPSW